jgi:hypothetical protein
VRSFVRFHNLRHPRDMAGTEVQGFLTMLAAERRVSSSTHNQALSALLFLYREVLGAELPWLDGLQRPRGPSAFLSCLLARKCLPCYGKWRSRREWWLACEGARPTRSATHPAKAA